MINKFEKNDELDEKQRLQIAFEMSKAEIKKDLMTFEHKLKMERLLVNLEIAKLSGTKIETETEAENND